MEEDNFSESKGEASDTLERELDAFLENVPKEDRRAVRKMIGLSMQVGGVVSPQLELMKKNNTRSHIRIFARTERSNETSI